MRSNLHLFLCALGVGLLLLAPSAAAATETYNVNTSADGTAIVGETPCNGVNKCTLREAIQLANSNPGPDKIIFTALPAGSPLLIEEVPLPTITEGLTIEGTAGATAGSPGIEMVPIVGAGSGPGLRVEGTEKTRIEGLAIGGFRAGIEVAPTEGSNPRETEICRDYLGVELNGETARPNEVGVEVFAAIAAERPEKTVIGGSGCAGNAISGNSRYGIVDSGFRTRIGANQIGIGPQPSGAQLPNGTVGQESAGVFETALAGGAMIGAPWPGGGLNNLIYFNHGPGVLAAAAATGVSIRDNSITENEGLGIEIAGGGPPVPTTTSAVSPTPTTVTIEGTVTGVSAGEEVELEFFGSPTCDSSGSGEGQTILGSQTVTAGVGPTPYTAELPVEVPHDDTAISATATPPSGATSQFSECAAYTPPSPPPPGPQTFVVTTLADSNDGACTPTLCSLRDAIAAANETEATDKIEFAATAEGVIGVEGLPLPAITAPIEVDGTSAPGYAGEPVVMLNGTQSFDEGPTSGLRLSAAAAGSTIEGLAIGGFGRGVAVEASGSKLCSNWIGVELDGTTALANGIGVYVEGEDTLVGDGGSCGGNLISGNSEVGLFDLGTHTVLEGNLIGTDAAGTGALGNGSAATPGAGVEVGATAVNSRVGRLTSEAAVAAGNTIAHNRGPGVLVHSGATGTSIRRSLIYANEGGAIEFQTPNSVPSPILEAFVAAPTETTYHVPIVGGLPNEKYELDVFATAHCEAVGYGPAEVLLASGEVTTDGSGEAHAVLHGGPLSGIDAESFTVTATESSTGTTSQLSTCAKVPPETQIDSHPPLLSNSSSATFTFSGTDFGEVAGFECRLDGATFATCATPKEYTGLADGTHTFEVKAVDGEGYADPSPAVYTWEIDTEPPVVTITSGPPAKTNATSATFGFTATDTGSPVTARECSLDGAAFTSCTSPQEYTGLTEGAHVFEMRATDEAGNTSAPVSRSWQIQTKAPTPAITAGPPATTESTSATFEFAAPPGSRFECSLDTGEYSPCASPQTFGGLSPGAHVFAVRATDEAGNTSRPTVHQWTVESAQAQQRPNTTSPPPAETEGPTPTNGEKVVVAPAEGKVLIKLPGTNKFVKLEELKEIPVGAVIDATAGKVTLTSISPDGTEQSANFFGGVFRVKQREGSGLVVLELLDTAVCTAPRVTTKGRAGSGRVASGSIAPRAGSGTSGKLWGSGHGNFRTEGNNGSATVRGTIWLVEDRCNGTTFFRTRRGIVSVHDFVTGKTFPLPAGNRYVAGE